jgi:hypothetical protein
MLEVTEVTWYCDRCDRSSEEEQWDIPADWLTQLDLKTRDQQELVYNDLCGKCSELPLNKLVSQPPVTAHPSAHRSAADRKSEADKSEAETSRKSKSGGKPESDDTDDNKSMFATV